jgi:hypothetical protein
MHKADIRQTMEALHIRDQTVMEIPSQQRDQDVENNRPITPHFIVLVAGLPDLEIAHSLLNICGPLVKVKEYIAPTGPL